MHRYHCTPGILVEIIEADCAASAAIEYYRRKPLARGHVQSLTVSKMMRDGSPFDAIYFDPQECVRMSVLATKTPEWDAISALD